MVLRKKLGKRYQSWTWERRSTCYQRREDNNLKVSVQWWDRTSESWKSVVRCIGMNSGKTEKPIQTNEVSFYANVLYVLIMKRKKKKELKNTRLTTLGFVQLSSSDWIAIVYQPWTINLIEFGNLAVLIIW